MQFQQATVIENPAAGAPPAWRAFASPTCTKPMSPAPHGEVVNRGSIGAAPKAHSDDDDDTNIHHDTNGPRGVDSPQTYEEVSGRC